MAAGMPMVSQIQLAWASGSKPSNGGGGGGNGGGESKEGKQEKAFQNKSLGNQKSFIKNALGINFGVAAVLKQSQIFTGFVGTIFQLIGALVDVILAPFLPVVIPAIKLIAAAIPVVSSFAQKIFDVLAWGLDFLGGLFGGIAGKIGNVLGPILTTVIIGGFFAKLVGLWGPYFAVVKGALNLLGRISRLLLNQFFKLIPMITTIWVKILEGLVSLGGTIGGKLLALGTKFANILDPITKPIINFATDIGTKLWSALDDVIGRLWTNFKGLFPDGWIDNIGAAVAKYAKSGLKKVGGMFGSIGSKLAGKAAGAAAGLAGDAGDYASQVAKTAPGIKSVSTMSKLAKAVPILSTLVTAGMATYRTGKAASQGDWDLAAAYAASGAAFTVGQIAADLSSVTGVGLAASGGLAVAEIVALNEIDKAFKDKPPSNQDNVMTAMSGPTNVADNDPSNRNGNW
tara:strand:+ start:4735 stop:6105 length:1371 start_codon:yes stop_codon:yes gene_type:complete